MSIRKTIKPEVRSKREVNHDIVVLPSENDRLYTTKQLEIEAARVAIIDSLKLLK